MRVKQMMVVEARPKLDQQSTSHLVESHCRTVFMSAISNLLPCLSFLLQSLRLVLKRLTILKTLANVIRS